jgi:hypothetical protein
LFYIFHSVMSNIWIMLFAIAVFCSAAYLDYKVFPYVVSKFLLRVIYFSLYINRLQYGLLAD